MTALAVKAPPYLPDAPVQLLRVDEWAALGMPSDWGRLVLDALGAEAGPVFEDAALCHLVWVLPPGGAADWPPAQNNAVHRFAPGSLLLVPGLAGHLGTCWVRPPLDGPLTDPHRLRVEVERILGPLDGAAELPPVVVCRYCRRPTRQGRVEADLPMFDGPDVLRWACLPCWRRIQAGCTGRHLRIVQGPP